MEWNWFNSLLYGLISGLSEFLPVSSGAQQILMLKLGGLSEPGPIVNLAVHLASLLALIVMYYTKLTKLFRERKIAKLPPRRRRRQPDPVSLIELRLLCIGIVPLIISGVAAYLLYGKLNRLWLLAFLLCINGAVLLLPEHMPRSNKDARSLSPLDALLIAASGILGVIPGISRMGMLSSCASMRGADRQYALHFVYLLFIPLFAILCLADVAVLLFAAGDLPAAPMLIHAFLAFLGAFTAGIISIYLMRFLAVKIGYGAFAYYSLGLGIFTFVLYLIG